MAVRTCPFNISFDAVFPALVFLFFFYRPLLLSMLFFDSLSSPILCTCPAHLILLPATFIFWCFFMPISSLNYFIFLLSSWVTLHILRTQLFSAICIFSSCLSASASVPNPYIQAGTTQPSNTFAFSCFFSFLSHVTPSTLLHAAAPACTLLCISLLLPPSNDFRVSFWRGWSHKYICPTYVMATEVT